MSDAVVPIPHDEMLQVLRNLVLNLALRGSRDAADEVYDRTRHGVLRITRYTYADGFLDVKITLCRPRLFREAFDIETLNGELECAARQFFRFVLVQESAVEQMRSELRYLCTISLIQPLL